MPLSREQNAERMRRKRQGAQAGAQPDVTVHLGALTVTRPWEDVTLSLVARMAAGKVEADRTHRPVVVSAARGLVAQPAERWLVGGPPSLSVYTEPYQRR